MKHAAVTTTITLQELRDSLDNLDNTIVTLLAERFKVTHKIGLLKKELKLPPVDKEREKKQFARIAKLAKSHVISPQLAKSILRLIIDEVVSQHRRINRSKF